MAYNIPLHFPDDSPEARVIEAIANRDHVSPEEVVRRAIKRLTPELSATQAKPARHSKPHVLPLTEGELRDLDCMFPALDAMDDVTDDQWRRLDKSIRRIKHAGLSSRA